MPGRNDQESVGEAGVLRVGELVQRLPGDEHGHDNRLAAAGGHFVSDAGQAGVGRVVGGSQVVFDPGIAILPCDLVQVDGGFERLDLAEEQLVLTLGVAPVLEEA